MFDNIGEKIKTLTKTIVGIGIFVSIISGVFLLAQFCSVDAPGIGFILFILIAGGGSAISWVSSFVIYGYGELISKTTEIERILSGRQTEKNIHIMNEQEYTEMVIQKEFDDVGIKIHEQGENTWICPECCRENHLNKTICKCGYERIE
ncbi:MAG: hypothetical protein E7266_00175 [Lachnospiraceae bacterium]|nr:hypothetical protein [Lachnospiraceae bacterium]